MNYYEAKKVLDSQKYEGRAYSRFVIDTALYLTGDLEIHEGFRGPAMGEDVPEQAGSGWEE